MNSARTWLRRIGVLMGKELLQIERDRALLIFTVYIFTLDILIAAGSAGFDLREAPFALVDHDRSIASRDGTTAAIAIMIGLLGVPFRGNPALFFFLVALYSVTTSGLGILAATYARNSGQVGLIVLLIVMPILFLSGTWNLVESMPSWLQAVIDLSPLRHFVPIAYGIVLRGAEMSMLWESVLKMLALGGLLFVLGLWRFKRQFA